MKKLSLVTGVVLSALMGLTVIGCDKKGKVDKDALQAVEVDPYSLTSNYRDLRIKGMGYSGEQFTEHKNEQYKKTYVIENVRALVVPVDFTDYPSSLYGETEDDSREVLRKAVFGTQEETGWNSLSTYYESTSFGKCHVTGEVMPWWHTGIKSTDVDKNTAGKPDTAYSKKIALAIQNYYRKVEHAPNLADYDANKDGYIDAIIMLYTAPITTTGELWWAFCWSIPGAFGKYSADGTMIGANRFFWASYNFLFEKGANQYYSAAEIKAGQTADGKVLKPDAHTLIHEFGHVLSLPDYYITDYGANDYSAMGGLDMMDHNIGDHNAYSKMLYGWINPKRITGLHGELELTMRSTTTTGDAYIIPAPGEWNDTYLDQYLLVEFLTPEGVAKLDGERPYLGTYPKYYSKPGIRITQVDSRPGAFSSTTAGYQFTGYTFSLTPQDDRSYVGVAASNTASDSCFRAYKQIEVLPATGVNMKARNGNAGDDCLYLAGDAFGKNGKWEDFKLNGTSGQKDKEFGFKIEVKAIDGNNSATIVISR